MGAALGPPGDIRRPHDPSAFQLRPFSDYGCPCLYPFSVPPECMECWLLGTSSVMAHFVVVSSGGRAVLLDLSLGCPPSVEARALCHIVRNHCRRTCSAAG